MCGGVTGGAGCTYDGLSALSRSTPSSASAMRISSSISSSMRTQPGAAAAARPKHGIRPMPTRSAPRAMAFTTSVPRWKHPSTMTFARLSTALTTSGRTSIEPAPAVVGDVHDIDAVLHGQRRVFRGGDALEDERDARMRVFEALDVAPAEPGLVVEAGGPYAPRLHESPGQVALAAAVGRGV